MKPFASEQYKKRTAQGYSGDECCICGKPTLGQNGAIHVPVNHENSEFVTDAQAETMGDAVSLFPVGPECAKKWSRLFKNTTSSRLRRTRGAVGDLIAYDHQTERR